VTIGLSTTSKRIATLSSNYADNESADFTQVFSGTIDYTPLSTNTFDLTFDISPFTYDPGAGNLLLDVVINSETGSSGDQILFDANRGALSMARVFNFAGDGAPTVQPEYGLVTQFQTSVATPEPSTLSLFLVASGALALAVCRKKSQRDSLR
jgi:hypothetical protein